MAILAVAKAILLSVRIPVIRIFLSFKIILFL
jgi:hypothetical protein